MAICNPSRGGDMLVRFFYMADLESSYQFAWCIELRDYLLFTHGVRHFWANLNVTR